MHLVHYNQKYGSLIRARDHKDGIVVLTVFLEVANDGNIGLKNQKRQKLFELYFDNMFAIKE
jgi:hypothetical protein